jgi:hypothetical protein
VRKNQNMVINYNQVNKITNDMILKIITTLNENLNLNILFNETNENIINGNNQTLRNQNKTITEETNNSSHTNSTIITQTQQNEDQNKQQFINMSTEEKMDIMFEKILNLEKNSQTNNKIIKTEITIIENKN